MTDDHCITFLKKLTGLDVDLANPLPVIRWMRKNMSVEWSDYLSSVFDSPLSQRDIIEYVLDLRNLVDFLWEYPEWGEKECPNCDGYGVLEGFGEPEFHCQECHGTGKITHPAWVYLQGLEVA